MKINEANSDRLLRNIQVSKGNSFGPGNCVIIPSAPEGQLATGPFTLTFDTNDVLTGILPGASFFFDDRSFESCRIDSANSSDTLIAIQAGFGRKYLPSELSVTPLPPGPSIPVQEVFGTRMEDIYTSVPLAGAAFAFGGWNLAKAKRITISLAPGSPGCIYIQAHDANGTFPVGRPVYPGEPATFEGSDNAGFGNGEFYCYNPNSVSVTIFTLVEYFS